MTVFSIPKLCQETHTGLTIFLCGATILLTKKTTINIINERNEISKTECLTHQYIGWQIRYPCCSLILDIGPFLRSFLYLIILLISLHLSGLNHLMLLIKVTSLLTAIYWRPTRLNLYIIFLQVCMFVCLYVCMSFMAGQTAQPIAIKFT